MTWAMDMAAMAMATDSHQAMCPMAYQLNVLAFPDTHTRTHTHTHAQVHTGTHTQGEGEGKGEKQIHMHKDRRTDNFYNLQQCVFNLNR